MAVHEIPRKAPPPFLDFFLLSSLFTLLFLSPWFYGLTRFRDQLIAENLVFILFLISIPFLHRKDLFKPRTNVIDRWVLLGLGLGLLYVLFSALPYRSFLAFLRFLSCALFYGLVRSVVRTDSRVRLFLWFVVGSGFFYSVYGLIQYYGFLPNAYWYQPISLASRYVNGGHFAAFLFFPLFLGMSLLFLSRSPAVQILLAGLLLVMMGALLLTRARTVWIAFLFGSLVFVWLAYRSRILNKGIMAGVLLLTLGGGVLLFRLGGLEEILERFKGLGLAVEASLDPQEIKATRFYTLLYRQRLWEGAFSAIAERPWGWGLGTFSAIFPRFRVHGDRFFVDYAHNEFMQVGVDLGIPGLLLLAGFLFSYLQRGALVLKSRHTPPSEKAVMIGFVVLWISLALTSQVDFPLRIYSNSFYFFAFLAASARLFESSRPAPEKISGKVTPVFAFRTLSFLLILLVTLPATRQLLAQVHFERGQTLEKNFSWKESLNEYQKATRLAPLYAEYHIALAELYQVQSRVSFGRDQKKELRNKAIQEYQKAIRRQPYESLYHYRLALLYEKEGEVKQAQSEFLKAISNDPTSFVFVAEYGFFAVRHSLVQEAIGAFAELKNFPDREVNPHTVLTKCYGLTQDYQELRRVVPDTSQGHHLFASVLLEKGKVDLARKEFDLAIKEKRTEPKYDPNVLRSFFLSIAEIYTSHGQLRDALEIYRKMTEQGLQDQEVQKKWQDLSEKLRVLESAPVPLPS